MRREYLKPYVHKIKGAKNYALFDILSGNFYHLLPEGNPDDLQASLRETGLIFETAGVIPFKIEFDLHDEDNYVKVRELQIRINGRGEDNCWNREKLKREFSGMDVQTLAYIYEQFKDIPVGRVKIEAEELETEKITGIIDGVKAGFIELFIEAGTNEAVLNDFKALCEKRNTTLLIQSEARREMTELQVDAYRFFYSQRFNPCLGQVLAIDCRGEIRPCLWSSEELGNVKTDNVKNMIISGAFDGIWTLTKDKVEACKDCEFRYNCLDCRVFSKKAPDSREIKPEFCDYDPYVGKK